MNIIPHLLSYNYQPSFQKALKANCTIVQNDISYPCQIYELERDKDMEYFEKIMFKKDWQNSRFIFRADEALQNRNDKDIFVIEDIANKCLGFCVVGNDDGEKNLEYIETIPKQKATNSKRKLKYIGETLLAYLAKSYVLDKKGKSIEVKDALLASKGFYESCGLKEREEYSYYLENDDACNLVKQNENHTKGTIKFIA